MMALHELWSAPPTETSLAGEEVHVWSACLDQPTPVVWGLAGELSTDERARAERFHFARHGNRFIVGRGVLRVILGRYLRTAPRRLQFCHGPHGKPALATLSDGHKLEFNLSHSESLALYVVTLNRSVGIDIEHVGRIPEAEQIAERFFTQRECGLIRALPQCKRQERFFRYWTRKEAYLKSVGTGLSQPLNGVDVSASKEESRWALTIEEDPEEAFLWSCADLPQPAPDYLAAVVVKGRAPSLRCWRWTAAGDDAMFRPAQKPHARDEQSRRCF